MKTKNAQRSTSHPDLEMENDVPVAEQHMDSLSDERKPANPPKQRSFRSLPVIPFHVRNNEPTLREFLIV